METKVETTQVVKTKTADKFEIAISEHELMDVLFMARKTTFVGFNSITIPTMNKTNNRFLGAIEKHSQVNALTAYQYERMVNNAKKRQLSSELRQTMLDNGVPESTIESFESDLDSIVDNAHQQFESAGLPWGKYMIDPKTGLKSRVLIDHTKTDKKTGQELPETYKVYAQVAIMHTKTPVYKWIESGQELSADEITEMKTFFPKRKESSRQGLSKPYIIRAYTLTAIKSIRINKTAYVLT